jgi:hypothetical protein
MAAVAEPVVFALESRAIAEVQEPDQPAALAASVALAPIHKLPREQRPSRESNATNISRAFADRALRLHFQEVADHLMTAFGQY